MPEMPEVETVRRGLQQQIVGKKIEKVDIRYPNLITGDTADFVDTVTGATFISVNRRAKFLELNLDTGLTIISHLRMEGKYKVSKDQSAIDKHSHAIFYLDSGEMLIYNDVRKFGRMQLWKTSDLSDNPSIKKLGPEPLSDDFKLSILYPRVIKHRKDIKTVLLDQSVISGLGNIYVDEVLWKSKINPLAKANELSESDVQKIMDTSNEEMEVAIKSGGSTIRSYVDSTGHKGNMQDLLQVYGKEGTPCPRCGTDIEKIKVNGRGTHFCPNCQK
ncbi:DNA-formamidopyrimidine glycosylase [Companilactobacillus metriopterae]|uniref:DNA-formamidopyrimidine glycosylase n=1 Tax=Companilactobacillus metriopterae TaxID=1909267 RepID=UPI00100B971C|nr:DNA-formamidopyrimidine glycosylase [Companilactobacillus metriopterae]